LHLPKEEKEMKKFVGVLMALLMVGSLVFADYADPSDQRVEIFTTIEQTAAMAINSTSTASGELTETNVTSQALTAGSVYGDAFYVNTRSNIVGGFTLKYSMSALTGAGSNNNDVIPVTVSSQSVVVANAPSSDPAVETSFTTSERSSVTLLNPTSSVGMENNSVKIQVKAKSSTWATDVAADTYSANLTFTFTAN
jgi:hypothetical protein